jgi:hypothetical protein
MGWDGRRGDETGGDERKADRVEPSQVTSGSSIEDMGSSRSLLDERLPRGGCLIRQVREHPTSDADASCNTGASTHAHTQTTGRVVST